MTRKPPIIAAGEALYGPAWQERLAAALGVSSKTVWRWKEGEKDVPKGVWLDIAKLCDARCAEIKALGETIMSRIRP